MAPTMTLQAIAAKLRYHARRSNSSELVADLNAAADTLEKWPPPPVEIDFDAIDPPRNTEGLRTDGPSIEEYVAADYGAASYPPSGYAPVDSPGWIVEQERRAT
jgi:hypothetical protein